MRKLSVSLLSFILLLAACSTEKDKVTLEPGTPTYVFAKDMSKKLPAVDPDSNKVMIETTSFEITTGEVIEFIFTNFGKNAGELKNLQPERIKSILEMNAEKLANQKLILTAAEKRGITVSDEEVDSVLQAQYKQIGGEEAFIDYISKSGITIDFVRKDITKGFVAEKYMQGVIRDESGISEEELQNQYRQLLQKDRTASVQHILLMTQGKSETEKAEIYKKMKSILAKARAGEDFGQHILKIPDQKIKVDCIRILNVVRWLNRLRMQRFLSR